MIQMFTHSRDARVEVEDMVRVYVWTLDCETLREIHRRPAFPFIRWCIIRSIRTKYLRDVQSLSFSSFLAVRHMPVWSRTGHYPQPFPGSNP